MPIMVRTVNCSLFSICQPRYIIVALKSLYIPISDLFPPRLGLLFLPAGWPQLAVSGRSWLWLGSRNQRTASPSCRHSDWRRRVSALSYKWPPPPASSTLQSTSGATHQQASEEARVDGPQPHVDAGGSEPRARRILRHQGHRKGGDLADHTGCGGGPLGGRRRQGR